MSRPTHSATCWACTDAHEIFTWYEGPGGERAYEVIANGFGQFELVAYEGRNPKDRLEDCRAFYDDEDSAGRAAYAWASTASRGRIMTNRF